MNKFNFIVILSFLLTNCIFSQISFYKKFTEFDCATRLKSVIELDNNEYLIGLDRYACDNIAKRGSVELIRLNEKGEKLSSKVLNDDGDNYEYIHEIYKIPNGYFVINDSYLIPTNERFLKFYNLSDNFEIINSLSYQVDFSTEIMSLKSYYDSKNNIIYFGYSTFVSNNLVYGYIGKINTDCNGLKISETPFKSLIVQAMSLNIKNDSLLVGDWEVFNVDTNFKTKQQQPPTDDNNIATIKIYNSNSYVMFAEEYQGFPENPNAPISNDLTVKKLSKDWKVLKHRTLGKPLGISDTFDTAGYKGMDWKDPNKIYVSWTTFKDIIFFSEQQDTWIGVAQLDSNLVPRWTRYFFGNDFHFLWGAIATSDNGVLLYGREKGLDSLFANGFVLKLSEQGLLADESPIVDNIHITVGPNPFRSQVTFAIGSPNDGDFDLFLFDIHGRVIKKEKLYNGLNTMELSQLPNAAYFYSVFSDGKKIKQGKLIKVD